MKTIKFLLVACLLGMATTASAQFANSGAAGGETTEATGWSGLRLSYNPISVNPDKGDGIDMTGFTLGYVKSFGVSSTMPLFVETGLNLTYATYSEDGEYYYDDDDYYFEFDGEDKYTWISASIPVNFGYKYVVNETVSLFPYVGVTLRGGISAKRKITLEYDGESESEDYNMFDKDDVGKDAQWKRFQIGWQIGVGAHFNQFFVGASYGSDFSELAKKVKASVPAITVGYNF